MIDEEHSNFNGFGVSCFDDANGYIDLTVSGGTGIYNYDWSNGAITEDLTEISAGTYSVTVSDQNGCTTSIDIITITEPNELIITEDYSDYDGFGVSGNGINNGWIDIEVSGGTGIYTYQWDNGEITEDLDNLNAGIYTITVQDVNDCTASTAIQISSPTPLLINQENSNFNGYGVSCYGGNNGWIDVTVSGGSGSYTYQWDNGETTEDLANLSVGTYNLTATDSNGNSGTITVEITEPNSNIQLTESMSNYSGFGVSCLNANDGFISIDTITGGTEVYTYEWSNGELSQSINNLSAGTYWVIVSDSNDCESDTTFFEITEPNILTITETHSDFNGYGVSCPDANDGWIDIEVSGGDGNYFYEWNSGQQSQDIANIEPGVYSVIVTDGNGCSGNVNVELIDYEDLNITWTISDFSNYNISCPDSNDGWIDVSVSGGTGNYTYQWSNGAITEDIESLSVGTYEITINDSCNTETLSIDIVAPPTLTINDVIINDLSDECNGSCEGGISLEIEGGTAPYTVIWTQYLDNENVTLNENGSSISGLCGGNYSASVFDIYGCNTFYGDIIITESDLLSLDIINISEYNCNYNISCFEEQDGSIEVNANGGASPYIYNLSSTSIDIDSSTGLFTDLESGIYSIVVLDSLGCSDTINDITLTQPESPLSIDEFNIENIATWCLNNGQISAEFSGGCGYTIALYNSNEDGNLLTLDSLNLQFIQDSTNVFMDNLGEGWYTLIVSDGIASLNENQNGYDYSCEQSVTFFMPATQEPNFEVYPEADITGLISYEWLGEVVTAPQTSIGIGNCESSIYITNPDGILGNFGGSGYGYEIYWYINDGDNPDALDNSDTPLSDFDNLLEISIDVQTQGQEFIMVYLDLCPNGPIEFITFIDIPFMELNIEAESSLSLFSGETESAVSCAGQEDAFASIQISGGSQTDFNNAACLENQEFWNVTWFLDNGDTEFNSLDTEIINGVFSEEDNLAGDNIIDTYSIDSLAPGFYFAQIEDCLVEGCALIVEFDLRPEPEPIILDVTVDQQDCATNEQASACMQINGGVQPYNFNLNMIDPNNPDNTIPVSLGNDGCVTGDDLQPGIYSIFATDANDCTSDTINFEIYLVNYIENSLIEVNLFSYPGGYNVSCNGATDGIVESVVIYSLEDLDGDGTVNWASAPGEPCVDENGFYLNCSDLDGDGIINTLDPNMDGDLYVNTVDDDMDGDGIYNDEDDTPFGLDTDDIIDTWSLLDPSSEFTINWDPWDTNSLPAGNYSSIIYSLAENGVDSCGTEFTFSVSQPSELYVFVPDYEACESCAVNVTPEIIGGQGPYRDIWINLETGDTLNSITNPNINPNELTETNVDYELDAINGFPHNILLLPGSYSLSIIDGNGCSPIEVTEFEVYEPATEISWADITVSGCEPSTSSCGGVATIDIDYEFLNNQLCQIKWTNCDGDVLEGELESENMITGLCNGSYYAQLLYPADFDVDGDGILNNEDPDMDNDGILNNENDPDTDGDGILNENDSFPEGDFVVVTLCFDYNDQGFEVLAEDIQHDLCVDDQSDGNMINIYIEGGNGEFTFTWYNANEEIISTNQNLENIESGLYSVSVIDGSGCEIIEQFEIESVESMTVDYNLSEYNGYNIPCADNASDNQCGGRIDLMIAGAIPFNPNDNFDQNNNNFILPNIDGDEYYNYTINNADYNISTIPAPLTITNIENGIIYASIMNVCAGNNIVDIIAQFDCVETIEIFMTSPEVLDFNIIQQDVSCPNKADGWIEIEVAGGVPPYTYEWILDNMTYSNNQNIYNISGGEYLLNITDQNVCLYDTLITVYEAEPLEVLLDIYNPECDELLGWVDFDINGGHVGNYQYNYLNNTFNYISSDTIFLPSGEHNFVFIDSEGCYSDTIFIDMNPTSENCLQIPSLFTPNGDSQNDVWKIGGIENYPESKIHVYNRWGQLVFKSTGNYFGNEWDGKHNGTPLPFAVYYYTIDPINENGKIYNGGVTIKR